MSMDFDSDDALPSRLRRRRQRGQKGSPQLNIVSLIDVFAVLVFFLLSGASITAAKLQAMQLQMAAPDTQAVPLAPNQAGGLTVRLSGGGILIQMGERQRRFPALSESRDLGGLTHFLGELKALQPEERSATLAVADEVNYADVLELMSVLSGRADNKGVLFPDIALANFNPAPDAGGKLR